MRENSALGMANILHAAQGRGRVCGWCDDCSTTFKSDSIPTFGLTRCGHEAIVIIYVYNETHYIIKTTHES